MAMSRSKYDGSRTSATQTTRAAIALARDGASHSGNFVADASNRAAVTHHSDVIPRSLQQFRDLSTAGLIPTSTQFDNTSRLLDVLDVPAIATGAVSEAGNWPGVVLVGCQGSGDAMLNGWFERMLGRGAIIVSIDRSAAIPIISSRLNAGAIRPGCHARVAVRTDLIDSPDTTELGLLPLASVPAYADLGLEHPDARFGWFGAATIMLAILLTGLDMALERSAGQLQAAGISTTAQGN